MDGSVGTDAAAERLTAPADDDALLLRAVARRDRKATAELVLLHSDELFGYLTRRLSPRTELAEDLLHEVFLAAWRGLESYEGRSGVRSWLFGIARHKVQEHYRQRLREPDELGENDADENPALAEAPWVEEQVDRERLEERARQTLDALPEHYRAALLWRYWELASAEQMATATGRSVKGIERLLARARVQFKRVWIESGHDGKEVKP